MQVPNCIGEQWVGQSPCSRPCSSWPRHLSSVRAPPRGGRRAPARGGAAGAAHPRVQRHDDAFTLVDARNGAVVRSRPERRDRRRASGPDAARDDDVALGHADVARRALGPRRSSRGGRTAAPAGSRCAGERTVKSRVWVEAHVSSRRVNLMRRQPCDALVRRRRRRTRALPRRPAGSASPTRSRPAIRAARSGGMRSGSPATSPTFPAGWSGGDQLAIHGTNAPVVARNGRLRGLPARLVDRARHPQALPAPGHAGRHRGVVAFREVGYACLTGRGAAW